MKLLRTVSLGKRASTRRQLLKALGLSAAASPFLPVLDGWAAGPAARRMFLLYTPHGVIPDQYWPTGSETAFNFPAGGILEPLAPYKSEMVVYKGLKRDTRGPGDHERCFCNMWTGTALAPGTQEGNGPSIDQIVAKAVKPPTDFESLQFSVQPHYTSDADSTSRAGRSDGNMIYAAAKQRIPSEFNPYKMFDRLFAGSGVKMPGGDDPAFERVRAAKKSVLDFLQQETIDFRKNVVSKSDGVRIDSHLESIRDIEKRLQAPAATCGGITRPDGTLNIDLGENFPKLIGIMNQLAATAFACDRTRIASMQYSRGFSRHTHTWLGLKDWHHTISHNAGATKALTDMQRWYYQRMKELLDMLKGVEEGGKPMLDSMLVIYVGELYTPWNHNANPSVAWTVGKASGALAGTGRYVDFGGARDHNQFLTTMCHAMGATAVTKVGDLGTAGTLPGILAA
jgi:hypothetical protein